MESRYAREYEDAINPFSDFRDRERTARKRQLSTMDRVLYEAVQLVSGSKCVQRMRAGLHRPAHMRCRVGVALTDPVCSWCPAAS